tara:strand:+ start:300 stop:1145 length:846 start_codon:yes stop_codon:yes gene_type:complete
MNIVGLGKAGVAIAKEFEKYPQYTTYKLDVGLSKGTRRKSFPVITSYEEAEEKTPKLTRFFSKMDNEETLFVVAGAGKISCACLSVMSYINNKKNLSVMYIQPDLESLSGKQLMAERLVRAVLQEYARSGALKRVYMVSNNEVEKALGGVPIVGYYDTLNTTIVHTMHMLNVFRHTPSIHGNLDEPKNTSRISTIGFSEDTKKQEKMFFSLDNVSEISYIYSVNKERLQTNQNLLTEIRKEIKKKKAQQDVQIISYEVHSTDYEKDLKYILKHTPNIQLNN